MQWCFRRCRLRCRLTCRVRVIVRLWRWTSGTEETDERYHRRVFLRSQMAFGQLFRGLGQTSGLAIASAVFQSRLDTKLRPVFTLPTLTRRNENPNGMKLKRSPPPSSTLSAS
ncbi:hypothetical protein OG21DRAFT_1035622 [Imleria badia]|nr:hypothetical protein OG21DRAFT_1035622 [Imleria badia]